MQHKKQNKKLTIMLVPHNGRSIKSIELSKIFLFSTLILIIGLVSTSVFFTYKFVETKAILQKNLAYTDERENTLKQISEEINKTSEIIQSFSDELEVSKSLIKNTSYTDQPIENPSTQEGDLALAVDVSKKKYSEYQDLFVLSNISKKIEDNLIVLENINGLMENQKELFQNFPFYWPVKGARVSMEWGPNIHPVYGSWYIHKGIDLATLSGVPVQSAANGEVTFVGYDQGYGLHIYISHNYGFKTHYSHLSSIKVIKGQKVKQGQLIGNVGTTGLVTGSHLDFQLYLGNELVDPGKYLRVLNTYERPKGNR